MTGAICALVLISVSPSKSAADLIVFADDGTARTSGWTFHGQRPLWAGLEQSAAGATQRSIQSEPGKPTKARAEILSLIAVTANRHSTHHALKALGIAPAEWQRLFRALVEAESSYNPKAISPKGAYGLGQLMPETARALGVNPRDMTQNLDGAARYLLTQLDAFGHIDLALAAYNAGPHRVVGYAGVPPFAETRQYIARIHRIRARLAAEDPREVPTPPRVAQGPQPSSLRTDFP